MEDLFIETEKGNIPVDQNLIEKYDLKEGTFTLSNSEMIDIYEGTDSQ